MDLKIIKKIAEERNVRAWAIMHDYALTNLLFVISEFPKLDAMVFKGGTALRKIHYEDFRFSMDLDFSCLKDVTEEFWNFIRDNMGSLDVNFIKIDRGWRTDQSLTFKVMYKQFDERLTRIKFDLSLRGDVMCEAVTKPVLHFYDEPRGRFEIPTMQLQEIMAEKVSAIMYSDHPRHLHDLAFLIDHKVELDPGMVRAKISLVYEDEFSMERFEGMVAEKAEFWKHDLIHLMPELPSFEGAAKKALEAVGDIMG